MAATAHGPPGCRPASRRSAGLLLVLTIAVGLASRKLPPVGWSVWDKSLGDVLYTVMVYLVVALARPTLRPRTLGLSALGISLTVEAFQLTGIPARMPRLLHLVFGTTFAWHDCACYVVGAVAIGVVDAALRRRRSRGGE